jgi:hypothetical protein
MPEQVKRLNPWRKMNNNNTLQFAGFMFEDIYDW